MSKQKPTGQANLKAARAKIEAVLKEHDLAGFVSLHGPGWGEVFWNIWPSHSILKGDFPNIRTVSQAADYVGRPERQFEHQAQTCQMIHHLATTMGGCSLQFLELANSLDSTFSAEHEDLGFVPEPSKSRTDLN